MLGRPLWNTSLEQIKQKLQEKPTRKLNFLLESVQNFAVSSHVQGEEAPVAKAGLRLRCDRGSHLLHGPVFEDILTTHRGEDGGHQQRRRTVLIEITRIFRSIAKTKKKSINNSFGFQV